MSEQALEMESYFDRLWPILRSLTGEGVRETHRILSELVPLETHEVPAGTAVFDWEVPPEWNVREAYVVGPDGGRILDVQDNNLHLLNYSVPFSGTLSREELEPHLYSLPEQPDAIPYVTSYYAPRWGFCLSHAQREQLPSGDYQVHIDSDLDPKGSLTWSEAVLPGELEDEVLISTYTCHPSMANNELSGPLVAAFLWKRLAQRPTRRLTYRFVFVPETIGAVTYLANRGEHLRERLVAGYVVTCAGDDGQFTYKRSRRGQTLADRAAISTLRELVPDRHEVLDFFPTGSDERQYCSPGFDLPVGSVMRTMYGRFPEYHTSLDNKEFVSFDAMVGSVDMYEAIIDRLEGNRLLRTMNPHCEPQLGPRGLYPGVGSQKQVREKIEALLWVLNLADGSSDLLAMAERSKLPWNRIEQASAECESAGLLIAV